MGCLLKLILLPFWWTIRLLYLGVRYLIQRLTLARFVGYLFGILVAILSPAALLGALGFRYLAAWYRRRVQRAPHLIVDLGAIGVAVALMAVAVLIWYRAQEDPFWIVSAWGGQLLLAVFGGLILRLAGDPNAWYYLGLLIAPRRLIETWADGLLLSPAVYLLFTVFFRLPPLEKQLRDQAFREGCWRRAVQPGYQTRRMRRALKRGRGHPFGCVRWGWDQVHDRPYDLTPASLARHLTLVGATGSGKTTAIGRLAEGLLRQDWAIILLDCKGGGLRETARELAEAADVTFRLLDPAFPDQTLRYNPCSGTPADVSNKLIGSLSFGDEGEVYKQSSQLSIGLVTSALQALRRPVTLTSLQAGLNPAAMRTLSGDLARAGKPELARYVKDVVDGGRVPAEALETLRARLANLQRSHFAPILEDPTKENSFDLDAALASGVTYISLPATAASEDVPLMGRVLLQDLKQAVARRERGLGGFARHLPASMATAVVGARPGNALLVVDEFAALRDPVQLQDLLLQARSAGVTLALSSQLLPQDPGLAAAVKGVGLVASLRVSDVDAQQVADLFGTYDALETTQQTGVAGGQTTHTGTGSVRTVQRYIAHPNEIKRLPDASAVVKLDQPGGRGRLVTVVRFWPPAADWPQPFAMPAAPSVTAAPIIETESEDLPWLPEPPGHESS